MLMLDERDILMLAYASSKYMRRTVDTLVEQTGLSREEINMTLRLNPNIWHLVDGCKGEMFEMEYELFVLLIGDN